MDEWCSLVINSLFRDFKIVGMPYMDYMDGRMIFFGD